MKRGTLRHRKVYDLADALGVRRAEAVGLLTALWDMTAETFANGDIREARPAYLAEQCLWYADGKMLLEGLIACRLVDRLDNGALYIHDWHVHSENTVHNKIARARSWFANGANPKLTALQKKEKKEAAQFYTEHVCPWAQLRRDCDVTTEGLRRGPPPLPCLALASASALPLPEPLPKEEEACPPPNNAADVLPSIPESTNRSKASRKKPRASLDPEFPEFYNAYPRHEARADAEKAWGQLDGQRPAVAALIAAVKVQTSAKGWRGQNRQFCPLPASWLRGKRWLDEVDKSNRTLDAPPPSQVLNEVGQFALLPSEERARWLADAKLRNPDQPAPVLVNAAMQLWLKDQQRKAKDDVPRLTIAMPHHEPQAQNQA